MKHLAILARVSLALLLPLLLAQACVRFDEPEAFRCATEDDCLETEKCGVYGKCLLTSACEGLADCEQTERCRDQTCIPAECVESEALACGTYRCSTLERTCRKDCFSSSDCRSGNVCDARVCRLSANLANGTPCMDQADCSSKACCQVGGGRVCAAACSF